MFVNGLFLKYSLAVFSNENLIEAAIVDWWYPADLRAPCKSIEVTVLSGVQISLITKGVLFKKGMELKDSSTVISIMLPSPSSDKHMTEFASSCT